MEYPEEWNELPRRERKKKIRELNKHEESRAKNSINLGKWILTLGLAGLLFVLGYFWYASREILPPTDIGGHIEENPPSHVLDEPMLITIQKHMLEHADGEGPPGIVINYNCEDFSCPSDLKEKLTEIVNKYPEFVYLAPYPKMSKMIAITKLGKIQTFDSLDVDSIMSFIEEK